jgi:type III pantothenate kinase
MSLLLALDIGNSRIKWGLFAGLVCQAMGHLPTRQFLDPDAPDYDFEPAQPFNAGMPEDRRETWQTPWPTPLDPRRLADVTAVGLCSVAGSAVEQRLLAHLQALGLPALPLWRVRSSAAALGVRNGYAQPERLGNDRWAALIAARAHRQAPTVVVMAGTATTVDALDRQGRFLGGYILPGLRLMPKSLYERTAGIRPDDGHWADFPDRTADAVTSGVLAATAGAVAGMVLSLQQQRPDGEVQALVSGGNGAVLLPRMQALGLAAEYQRDLVLEGVCRLFLDQAAD